MRTKTQQKTPLEREADNLIADGYSVIDPSHNAINTRIDLLPCGCCRIYKGMILGIDRYPQTYSMRVGGIEGVKPCQKHTELIGSIRL